MDARVTVQLPGQPSPRDVRQYRTVTHPEHTKAWALYRREGEYFLVRIVRPATHISARDAAGRAAYYAGVARNLETFQGRVVASSPFATAGGEGREFTYNAVRLATGKPMLKYQRSFVLDSVAYTLSFLPYHKTEHLSRRPFSGSASGFLTPLSSILEPRPLVKIVSPAAIGARGLGKPA